MGRPDPEQPNQPQPPIQPTANRNSQVHPQNVPTGIPVNNQAQNLWSSDLFGCMDDCENVVVLIVVVHWISCDHMFSSMRYIRIVDEGATTCATSGLLYGVLFLIGIPCVYSCMSRAKMRNKYGLPDAPAPDWITHLCCEYCALCQEYRELKHRGFDPVIGWTGNVQAKQQQEMMAPPTSQRMR